jgi:hypothetical protein
VVSNSCSQLASRNRLFDATFLSHIRWLLAYTHALVSKPVSKTDSQNLRLFTGNVRREAEVVCLPKCLCRFRSWKIALTGWSINLSAHRCICARASKRSQWFGTGVVCRADWALPRMLAARALSRIQHDHQAATRQRRALASRSLFIRYAGDLAGITATSYLSPSLPAALGRLGTPSDSAELSHPAADPDRDRDTRCSAGIR